jgi:hypothetical protein
LISKARNELVHDPSSSRTYPDRAYLVNHDHCMEVSGNDT